MERSKRRKIQSEELKKQLEVAENACRRKVDQDGFKVEFIDDYIGSGVFVTKSFSEGSFLLEYDGDLIKNYKYASRLEKEYEETGLGSFMYFFRYREKNMCIDATDFIFTKGRMINDAKTGDATNNCSMKIVVVDNVPKLCIFANRYIHVGEELRYDYGVTTLPWRKKIRGQTHEDIRSQSASQEVSSNLAPTETISSSAIEINPSGNTPAEKDIRSQSASQELSYHLPPTATSSSSAIEINPSGNIPAEKDIRSQSASQEVSYNLPPTATNSPSAIEINPSGNIPAEKDIRSQSASQEVSYNLPPTATNSPSAIEINPSGNIPAEKDIRSQSASQELSYNLPPTATSSSSAIEINPSGNIPAEKDIRSQSASQEVSYNLPPTATNSPSAIEINPSGNIPAEKDIRSQSASQEVSYNLPPTATNSPSAIEINPPGNIPAEKDIRSQSASQEVSYNLPPTATSSSSAIEINPSENTPAEKDYPVSCNQSPVSGGSRQYRSSTKTQSAKYEYSDISSDEYDDSIADANFDWKKELVSNSSGDSEYEVIESTKQQKQQQQRRQQQEHVSGSSDNSEVLETIPNFTKYILPIAKEDHIPKATTSQWTHDDSSKQETQHCNENTDGNIQVPSTNNLGYRHYDKQFYCMYCKEGRGKLKKHLLSMHKEEDEIIEMEKEDNQIKKNLLYEKIRNIGNHLHNINVIKNGVGQLCVAYRPRKGDCTAPARPADYGPCPFCYAYFPKRELWRHNRKCKFSTQTKQKRQALTVTSGMLMPNTPGASVNLQKVTGGMRKDTITRIVKSDPTILAFGEKLCTKHGHDDDQYNYIRQKLREIARLVQELRKESQEEDKFFEDFVYPSNFPLISKCCRTVAGFDVGTNMYATPSLALKLGHTLQKCLKILTGKGIETENRNLQCRAEEVSKLLEINWTDDISSNALRTLHHAKRNSGSSVLPLANDVKILSKYLVAEAETNASMLKKENDLPSWVRLNEVLLAQTILFNRRRAGEVSKMTLEDYSKKTRSNIQGDFDGCLSKFERELCKVFYRTEIIAKRGRISPVLFTKQMISHLDLLIETRELIDNPLNRYLFPSRTTSSHIRGTDCLRNLSKACGAEAPDRLRSTKLRKHIATMSQVLNLQDNELDVLAQFLGHDIRVHREFYRLPEATIQVAKVSKLLLMMEKGNPPARNTSIDDINLNDEEDIEDNDASSEGEESEDSNQPLYEEQNNRKQEKGLKRAPPKRRPWTDSEREVVLRYFQSHILRGKLPGKSDILSLLNTEQLLKDRPWRNIKDFVRHQIKKK